MEECVAGDSLDLQSSSTVRRRCLTASTARMWRFGMHIMWYFGQLSSGRHDMSPSSDSFALNQTRLDKVEHAVKEVHLVNINAHDFGALESQMSDMRNDDVGSPTDAKL